MTYQQNIDVTAATIAAPAVTFDRAPLFAARAPISQPETVVPVSAELVSWNDCARQLNAAGFNHTDSNRYANPFGKKMAWAKIIAGDDGNHSIEYDKAALAIIAAQPAIEAPQKTPAAPEISPDTAPVATVASVDPQSDAIAALVARVEALEGAIERQATPPSGEIADFEPLPHDPRALSIIRGKQEIAAADTLSVQSKSKRTAAHVRAITGYLAIRKARRIERKQAELTLINSQYETAKYRLAYDEQRRWSCGLSNKLTQMAENRRRAVKTAREFQQRLYAEYKIADQRNEKHNSANEKHWAARNKMGMELQAAQGELQRLQALGDLRVKEYCGIIDDLATVGAKRRRAVIAARTRSQAALQLGKALVGSMAECERLKRVAYQQAGHIVNVAERLDRAETQLRKHGPALTIVPPITLAVPVAA